MNRVKQHSESRDRLALFLPSLGCGGAERVMLTLASGFAKRGYQVDLVLATATGEYLEQVPQGVGVIDLAARRPILGVPALVRYLRKSRPRAMLSTMTHANLSALLAQGISRVPVCSIVREAAHVSTTLSTLGARDRWLTVKLVRLAYRRAKVVAVSYGVADDLRALNLVPNNRIHVIYNPIDRLGLRMQAQQDCPHPWFKGSQVPVILGIGRLTEQKDFYTLIHAFALLRKQCRARLVLLGCGEAQGDLEQLCVNLGVARDVDMPGFVRNPIAYLSRAALFVLSSRWEGMPNALLEALACGTPIVATDCPSGPAEILDGGRFGQSVPVGDHMAMAAAIRRVLAGDYVADDPSEHLQRFEQEYVVDQYLMLMLDEEPGPLGS